MSIDEFLRDRESDLERVSPDAEPLLGVARALLEGGKRFRALFCYWGWHSTASAPDDFDLLPEPVAPDLAPVVAVCAALELFHAAALVHDDIMDNSDTRRGRPAAHRRFERLHRDSDWHGDSEQFGRSTALLLGDLLLGWSDELLDSGLALVEPQRARAARAEFTRMRTEVTVGQYLDILEEASWAYWSDEQHLARAERVIVYKSAKYSVEAPLVLGAAIAGASREAQDALRAFGLPLGIAYQLRDDLLGVFGDPEKTGKPAGDDLREGKRTMLVALARRRFPAHVRRIVDELIGDRELDDQQIAMLRTAIDESGAVDEIERLITDNVTRARTALVGAPLSASARHQLASLADTVSRRAS